MDKLISNPNFRCEGRYPKGPRQQFHVHPQCDEQRKYINILIINLEDGLFW